MSNNHQIITSKPVGKDLVFGSKRRLGGLPVQVGGQWDLSLPQGDPAQNFGVETEGCGSFNTAHAVDIMERQEFGDSTPLSGRFLSKISGTTQSGNDPHVVAEALRTHGCANEADYPYTPDLNTWEKFYSDIPQSVVNVARLFIAKYQFGHEYLINPTPDSMKKALEFSPLGVAVYAWNMHADGLYYRDGGPDIHWTTITGYEDGKYWKCFDSYSPYVKHLDWNFGFSIVKKYTLHKNVVDERWQAFFTNFFAWFRALNGFANSVGFKLGLGSAAPTNLDFSTQQSAYHSTRVICDNFGLNVNEKNLICAVIYQESGFKLDAINHNRNSAGVVTSTDFSICQINDRYHIGPKGDFPSVDYVLKNPAACVSWMVKMYRTGHLNWWCGYSSGAYAQWLKVDSPMWKLKTLT